MKYAPQLYARAFYDVVESARTDKEKTQAVKNFATLVKQNGDARHWNAIIEETEKLARKDKGLRKVVLETARPITALTKKCSPLLKSSDVVEEKVNPELVAGVRITVNDELQLDGSMARELKKLFA